ncbi:MAG: hypothetical protein R3D03_11085 [Geminicoccaceae bacterium]
MRSYEPTAGRIELAGEDITGTAGEDLRKLRRRMQIIFQDPYAPAFDGASVRDILVEARIIHGLPADRGTILELLEKVGLGREHPTAKFARVLRRPAPAHRHRLSPCRRP